MVAVPVDEPPDATVNVDERPEPVPFDLENPFWMGKRVTGTTERHGLELREANLQQYIPGSGYENHGS